MKKNTSIKILAVLVVILVISQAFTIYFVLIKANESLNAVANLETNLNQKITANAEDTQSKINSLSATISSLSTTQTTIQSQISQIKATTSADFSGIIEQDIKGVVTIKTDVAQGTGFLISNDGYIVTNAHVLSGGRFANAYTYDGVSHSADLIGYDNNIDLALLKISGDFTKLNLGNSDNVKIGEKVIAIGNPLGLSFTATEGIISARDRTGSNNLPYYFQTDVSLNPGNSGGPLIDTSGEVIGINNFKISGAENLGFALESNYIRQTINQIASANNQTLTI